MAFQKKTWVDRLVEYAGRRKITNVSNGSSQIVDVERAEGIVSQEGSPFSAATMNDLEQRVADEFASVDDDIKLVNSNLGGLEFTQNADGRWGYKVGGADPVIPFKYNVNRVHVGSMSWACPYIDVKPYLSNYAQLTADNFIIGRISAGAFFYTTKTIQSLVPWFSYDSTTGILYLHDYRVTEVDKYDLQLSIEAYAIF